MEYRIIKKEAKHKRTVYIIQLWTWFGWMDSKKFTSYRAADMALQEKFKKLKGIYRTCEVSHPINKKEGVTTLRQEKYK